MAGAAFSMKVAGVDALLKTFKNYFEDVDSSPFIINAMSAIGKTVEVQAKLLLNEKIYNTPQRGGYVRTGLLRARTTSDTAKKEKGEVIVIVRSKQRYAP